MITQAELKEVLEYNADTGIFTWKVNRPKCKIGQIAGTFHANGYTHIQINRKIYKAHRLAWLYTYGSFPTMIDHINCNRNDNSIKNLREVNIYQNNHNAKISKNNTSGIKGITWHKKAQKWCAQIDANGKHFYLGIFDDIDLAKLVIEEAREKYHIKYANHG